MFPLDTIEIIGFLAAMFTTSAFVPQVYRTWKTKDVKGVSLTMYLVMLFGVLLWFVYGFYRNSMSIIMANMVTALLVLSVIIMKLKHK